MAISRVDRVTWTMPVTVAAAGRGHLPTADPPAGTRQDCPESERPSSALQVTEADRMVTVTAR